MYCGFCGGKQPAEDRFCIYCGQAVNQISSQKMPDYNAVHMISKCPQCGEPIDEDDVFCSACGTKCPKGQAIRKALCICCGQPLMSSASFCGNCGASYQLDESGYIDIPQERICSCGAALYDDDCFCSQCGSKVSSETEYKKAVLLCTNCHQPLRSLNKYCTNCGTNWRETVRPRIENDGLACPVCGERKMPPTRKICWHCGVKFSTSPWKCRFCGKVNLYEFADCPECKMKNINNQLIPPEFIP